MSAPAVRARGTETASAGATRSAADLAADTATAARGPDAETVLRSVPRARDGAGVVELGATTAGGLAAVRAEWGAAGGEVLLSGRVPFAELHGRAGFRSDGSLDGTVAMSARVGLAGLRLGEATWTVEGWDPEQPLAAPAVTLRGAALGVDLRSLPAEAVWRPAENVEAPRSGGQATIRLPGGALPPGEPLSPRLAEVYRGLLGVDPSRLQIHRDASLGGVPAFVTDTELFLAPGRYGTDGPEALRVLDAAIRAALTGLFGPVITAPPAPVPPAPPSPEVAPPGAGVVPAHVPGAATDVVAAAGR
ncbi:hypothetical protein ACH9EU_01030, partial [Kocuria sp. M1R5S2]|uniref:hypothetical protein n=1 Tax=Kocuria rhizosphaerae TaxID=3376285 RepID=UPI0037A79B1B